MATFVRGDIVVVPFPFSTGMDYKRRPALVLAPIPYGTQLDYVLCVISHEDDPNDTSKVRLDATDCVQNAFIPMPPCAWIRPRGLFSIDGSQIVSRLDRVSQAKIDQVMAAVRPLFA